MMSQDNKDFVKILFLFFLLFLCIMVIDLTGNTDRAFCILAVFTTILLIKNDPSVKSIKWYMLTLLIGLFPHFFFLIHHNIKNEVK